MKTNYQELTDRTLGLSNLMLTAAQMHLFTIIGVYPRYTNKAMAVSKDWAGGETESRADMIARIKVLQLLSLPPRIEFALTPRKELLLGPDFDYPGGIMKVIDNRRYVVAGSAQSGTTDLMFAATLLYAMQQEVRFHHYGVRHISKEFALEAVAFDEERLGVNAIHLPTGEGERKHDRWYIPWKTELSPNGIVWLEHQFFRNVEHTELMAHWDVATLSPLNLLQFVGDCLSSEPTTWESWPDDPVGLVSTMNRGTRVAIMARERWWDIN